MSRKSLLSQFVFSFLVAVVLIVFSNTVSFAGDGKGIDLSKSTMYLVSNSHLDTQWRWTIQETIDECLLATLEENLYFLDKYPDYVFSFEGAFRYMLMREYYPELTDRMKEYIDKGRWHVTGSWVDAVDTNIPSPEALMRHVLYGNGYFKREFGKTSVDVFLPDCFGFGYALPSIAKHCGLKGFSTQKLTWGSWVGVPFNIGRWRGVDGSELIAAINPGPYDVDIDNDLSYDSTWIAATEKQVEISNLPLAYKYYGTGDIGGGPSEESVQWMEKSLKSDGPLKVISSSADQIFRDLSEEQVAKLPLYDGELLMTKHGAGCYSSQAAMKKFNRKNELLADAAERASVLANISTGTPYPGETLRDAWIRFLWHQFHDDLTGTSIPEAYTFSWNDELIAQNQFYSVLDRSMSALSHQLDTDVDGTPVVIFNPLSIQRTDVVEVTIVIPNRRHEYIKVYNPDDREVASQILKADGDTLTILFLADIDPIGTAVYDVRSSRRASKISTDLIAEGQVMENDLYKVTIDANGDIASIFMKEDGKELLSAPIQLQVLEDSPNRWPAWEVDFDDIMAQPRSIVSNPISINLIEQGQVRSTIEVVREVDGSTFHQLIHLSAGATGGRIEVENRIDWHSTKSILKLAVPCAANNDTVTYDLGLGTIQRGINFDKRYEVPGQQWADMTAEDKTFGLTMMNDSKYGWDFPQAGMLRLTLVRTPDVNQRWISYKDERTQDLGRHYITYGFAGHNGNWSEGGSNWQAARLNQPLLAWQAQRHEGKLGHKYSIIKTIDPGHSESPRIAIRALKKAEDSEKFIVRFQELTGNELKDIRVQFNAEVLEAFELNGVEEEIGQIEITDGQLQLNFKPWQPRTIAITLKSEKIEVEELVTTSINLPYNLDGISTDSDRKDGDFDGLGNTLSGDILPSTISCNGIPFVTGEYAPDAKNVLISKGQQIELPGKDFEKVHFLITSIKGNQKAIFTAGDQSLSFNIPQYDQFYGQWDMRVTPYDQADREGAIAPAYIQRLPLGWVGTHRHTAKGTNEAYRFTNFYDVTVDLPKNAKTIKLPDNPDLRILAATAVGNDLNPLTPAENRYEEYNRSTVSILPERTVFTHDSQIKLVSPNPGAVIHYTLDGTNPTEDSPIYQSPVTITETTTVRARAFVNGFDNGYIAIRTYEKLPLQPAQENLAPVNGITCDYYEGEWTTMPDFTTLQRKLSKTVESIKIIPEAIPEYFGQVFTGVIDIKEDGLYVFRLGSDDGSKMYLDGDQIIDNNRLQGYTPKEAEIGLKAGLHSFRIEYFQCRGGKDLDFYWSGPGFDLKEFVVLMTK